MTPGNLQHTENKAKETVLSFIKVINEEEFDMGREYINEDLSFIGVMGSRTGADTYINEMKGLKIKYKIEKAFVDGDDVCLIYDLLMNGITIYGCGWYHLINGKISSIKVVFDPRSLLKNA